MLEAVRGFKAPGPVVWWTTRHRVLNGIFRLKEIIAIAVERSGKRRVYHTDDDFDEALIPVWVTSVTPWYDPQTSKVFAGGTEADPRRCKLKNPLVQQGPLAFMDANTLDKVLTSRAVEMMRGEYEGEPLAKLEVPPIYMPTEEQRALTLRRGAALQQRALDLARGFVTGFENVCGRFVAPEDGVATMAEKGVVIFTGQNVGGYVAPEEVIGDVRNSILRVFGMAVSEFKLYPAFEGTIKLKRGMPLYRVVPHRAWTQQELEKHPQYELLLYIAALSGTRELHAIEMIDLRYVVGNEPPWVDLTNSRPQLIKSEFPYNGFARQRSGSLQISDETFEMDLAMTPHRERLRRSRK